MLIGVSGSSLGLASALAAACRSCGVAFAVVLRPGVPPMNPFRSARSTRFERRFIVTTGFGLPLESDASSGCSL